MCGARRLCLLVHRWFGLLSCVFIILVSLTGSVIAFSGELDEVLCPKLYKTDTSLPLLDPVTLLAQVQKAFPTLEFSGLSLNTQTGKSVRFYGAGRDAKLTEIYVDPRGGKVLGTRLWRDTRLTLDNLVPWLVTFHCNLALGDVGKYLLGVTALFWTLDCFIGFYLTLPKPVAAEAIPFGKSRWRRWQRAWTINVNGSVVRLNFDLHIAFGLWTWLALFMFAWSSVSFNLGREVYQPVTSFLFGMNNDYFDAQPGGHVGATRLSWEDALKKGRELVQQQEERKHFRVQYEDNLIYSPENNQYILLFKSSEDPSKSAATALHFNAENGEFIKVTYRGSSKEKLGNTITRWLAWLHMAQIFGLPMQVFVCAMGLVITMLSVTGVYIWWKKHQAARLKQRILVRV